MKLKITEFDYKYEVKTLCETASSKGARTPTVMISDVVRCHLSLKLGRCHMMREFTGLVETFYFESSFDKRPHERSNDQLISAVVDYHSRPLGPIQLVEHCVKANAINHPQILL